MTRTARSPLGDRDPDYVAAFSRVVAPLFRKLFRYELRALERVPRGPCLFVANHSGLGIVEVPALIAAWHERTGEARPAYGLAHDAVLKVPGLGSRLRALGALNAAPENARAALRAGHDVLVFPGGEVEAGRPFWRPRQVDFAGRRGYVKIALEEKVPIVPIATIGSHVTYLSAPGGKLLAKALGLKKAFRLERVPLPLGAVLAFSGVGAAWSRRLPPHIALGLVAVGILPTPARVTSEVLPALDLARELRDVPPEEHVESGHELVFDLLAQAVERLDHERPLALAREEKGRVRRWRVA